MLRSVRAGKRVALADVGLFADGTAVKQVGVETFRAGARTGRRLRGRRHRRGVRRHQGRVPGHAQHPRAVRRDGRGGFEAVRRDAQAQGQDLRRHHLRREHELRPAALRGRARRVRRAARGAVRGDHPRGARLVQALLRADRHARASAPGDRVQLPHRRHEGGACLRRPGHHAARRGRAHRAQLRAPRLCHRQPERRRTGQGARAPHGRRALRAGARRAAVPLRLPRAARRADALPVVDASGLEHQPVPLPQPGRGLRPHPRRHPGAGRPTNAPSSPSWKPWPTPTWKSRPIRCTACSCAEAPGTRPYTRGHGRQSIAHRPDLEPAARARADREAGTPRRSGRQPGRTRAAGRAPGADAEHAQAAFSRSAAGGLCRRPRHGRRRHRRAGRSTPTHEQVRAPAQRAVADGGVRAHPADRADRRRLRRGRGHRLARAPADAQDRARHAQRPHRQRDDARPGACGHARRHGNRRHAARQRAHLRGHRRGLAPQRRAGAVTAEPIRRCTTCWSRAQTWTRTRWHT